MRTRGTWITGLLALSLAAVSCTVKDTEAPDLAGPSELALSLSLEALPDTLVMDGSSQSSVTVQARGPDGQPVRGISLRVDMLVDGVTGDLGRVSARTIVTGDDGRARLTYTAPQGTGEPNEPGSRVTIIFTPIGGDYRGSIARQVDVIVLPTGVILPPNRVTARFTYSPTTVTAFQPITFDASTSTDNLVPCGASCSYQWNFGDGGSATGRTTTHEFRTAGTFVVTLRVTNPNGQFGEVSQTISVTAGTPPTASFTFSPSQPGISQDIFFNAEASRAAPGSGRRIIAYDWDFGSGRTGSGVTVVKRYDLAGTYTVTLTVVDDASQRGTTSQTVTVGAAGSGLVANLIFSPTNATAPATILFDARGSRGPSPIVRYHFDYGDPNDPTADPNNTVGVSSHFFSAPGTYVVRVTVYDSQGRTATTTVSVPVAEPDEP